MSVAAYGARAALPGVLRRDDVDAQTIGFFDSYPSATAGGQSVVGSRGQVGLELERVDDEGRRVTFATWASVTSLRLRQNFTGSLESSQTNPAWFGRGDLLETTDDETAFGASASLHSRTYDVLPFAKLAWEPGVYLRRGLEDQTKSLLQPTDLAVWDRRVDARLRTTDLGGYIDLDLRLWSRLRVSGGLRADGLLVSMDDALANQAPAGTPPNTLAGARSTAFGVAISPRASAGLELTPWLQPMASYGEGFRSLDPRALREGGSHPYSKVRSVEVGVRSKLDDDRYQLSLALFQTWLSNELVFDSETGGLETQGASTRRGIVAGAIAKPAEWLLGAFSLSLNRAEYRTPTPEGQHLVPGVPAVLLRGDATVRRELARIAGAALRGHIGLGFTYLAGRHLTDPIVSTAASILNARTGARYRWAELDIDVFNLLDRRYPDDEAIYVSNWSTSAGRLPSVATHFSAAPPLTVLATLAIHFGG